MKNTKNAKKLTMCAVMISLALALNYLERFIPLQLLIPLPGIKLGLANIVTLVALYMLDAKSAVTILVIRCLMGSMFGGGVTGLLFSLTGGMLAIVTMILASKCKCFSVYGVSILGAGAHNVGQICASMVLMQSVYIGAYLPYLLIVSLFTGFATGSCAGGIIRIFRISGGKRPK